MNNNFSLPPQIQYILQTLETAGHQAYVVGGCVRDHLLGKMPYDFDICTSALPDVTTRLFDRTIPTGIAHGTVTVLYDGMTAEVTALRRETGYSDHRRPDAVVFTTDLSEDLARRDFTINAMAMDLRGKLYDPFGGADDLQAGILRCVGDANRRLREDALRMHRGLRFAAQLGFSIADETLVSIRKNAKYAVYVAPERIHAELEKALLSPRPQLLAQGIAWGLFAPMIPAADCPDLSSVALLPARRAPRYARLFFLLKNSGIISDTETAMRDLRMDKATIRAVTRGIAAAEQGLPQNIKEMKRLMSKEDALCVECAAACGDYDGRMSLYYDIISANEPFHISHLAISGADLQTLGISGKAVGAILNILLEAVIAEPSANTKAQLTSIAKKEAVQWKSK